MIITDNNTIQIGNITIVERDKKQRDGVDYTNYAIFVGINPKPLRVSVPDVRLAVLAALGYEAFGPNNHFAPYAARMLKIDGDIWHTSGHKESTQ